MRKLLQFVALLFCICLCGCITTDSTINNPANSGVAYVHPYSKFSFPKQIDKFRFVGVTRYDRDGRDISAGYNSPTPITATVYIYPAAKNVTLIPSSPLQNVGKSLIDFEFNRCKQEVFHVHPDARFISEESFELTQGNNHFIGKKATFAMSFHYGFSTKDSLSELYIFLMEPSEMFFVNSRQYVEYRITYPANSKDEAEKEINSFFTELKWPTK